MRLKVFVQERCNVLKIDVFREKCCTYAAQQKEGEGACIHLFVMQHVSDKFRSIGLQAKRSDLGRQPCSIDRPRNQSRILFAQISPPRPE